MLNYRNLLLCLSAAAFSTSAFEAVEANHLGVNNPGYGDYQGGPVTQEKVEIREYYESLCPGCKYFHSNVLAKLVTELAPYLDFKSYPYGNARMVNQNGKIIIECQHGEEECYGNKLHACAIDILKNASKSEQYNACMMSCQWGGHGSTDMDATNCGGSMGINAKSIIDCAKSQKGEELAEYFGRETEKVHLNYVPSSFINGKEFLGKYNEFKNSVCAAFTNPPPGCTGIGRDVLLLGVGTNYHIIIYKIL